MNPDLTGAPRADDTASRCGAPTTAILVLLMLACPAGVSAACTISNTGLAFEPYNPLGTAAVDGVGTIDIACEQDISYSISLGPGQGSFAERHMTSFSSELVYNLYTDANRLIIWGDGTGSTSVVEGSTSGQHAVYGRIPGAQNVPAGQYQDTVVITVSY
ncbi:MAG: spore coat U domain-containing protein [Aquisalimonadaceae bacterium]